MYVHAAALTILYCMFNQKLKTKNKNKLFHVVNSLEVWIIKYLFQMSKQKWMYVSLVKGEQISSGVRAGEQIRKMLSGPQNLLKLIFYNSNNVKISTYWYTLLSQTQFTYSLQSQQHLY